MTRPIPIEIGGEAVGIVVSDGDNVRFVAVKFPVWALDDHVFPSADHARRAALELLARPIRPVPRQPAHTRAA